MRNRILHGKKVRNPSLFIVLRVLLAVVAMLAILSNRAKIALFLFVLTGSISFFDGLLAKRAKLISQFRSLFDPFADKLLINLTAYALWAEGIVPTWLFFTYLTKDIILIAGAIVILIKNYKTVFHANVPDKFSTFTQALALFFVLSENPDTVLIIISVVFTALSFVVTLFKSGAKIVKYRTDLEEVKFSSLVKLPDLFTFGNVVMGISSIFFSLNNKFFLASISLVGAVAFDIFDGKIAVWRQQERPFGKSLDSLADTVSFGVAPAIFGFAQEQSVIAVVIFTLFVFAGVLRLARYNVLSFAGDKNFTGMPITVNGIIIPLFYFFGAPSPWYPYVYLILALLMVSPLQIKRFF